ncbi:sulfatase-like hydrolase/transferase [Verrucomicrobiales bacterium]|nr:sulfatase-like hydrolase/transferase [Verrucomicrobiales bacterium]
MEIPKFPGPVPLEMIGGSLIFENQESEADDPARDFSRGRYGHSEDQRLCLFFGPVKDETMLRKKGFIALQDHGNGCVVAFRKIELKELPKFPMRLLAIFLALSLPFAHSFAAESKPNILMILADDMGYGDLGCMGSELLKTPNIDALAESGVLCPQAYVTSPVCSPSRAGLMTGRDPRRFGYQANLNKSESSYHTRPEFLGVAPGEHTLGDHLGSAGYATALIGKWHLGKGPGFHPSERGFDHFSGMLGGSHGYFPKSKQNQLERNGEPIEEFSNPYLTDFFTDEGIGWITDQEKPWFLFMSYNAPHGPLQATEEDLARFENIKDPKRRTYAAMMWALDRGVGRLRNHLEEAGQLEDTLIVFFSDNGGATGNASWNGPLSGVKGCLKEGGVRVPMIWSWPGQLPKGERYEGVTSSLDLLPTFMAAASSELLPLADLRPYEDKGNRKKARADYGEYDGIDLIPLLKGESPPAERLLFWRLQGQAAVLDGQNKLIRLSHRPAQMFQPAGDPGESDDLSRSDPEGFEALFRKLGQWESSLPTIPLWGSSPMWSGQSAKHYDSWEVREEPK